MKKVLFVAAVACLSLVSCKKDYTCECTVSSNAPGYTSTTTSGATGKMKKADAESKCNEGDRTYTVPGMDSNGNVTNYNYTVACDIK